MGRLRGPSDRSGEVGISDLKEVTVSTHNIKLERIV